MNSKPTNGAASRRRSYPKPTLYAPGITRRDRLFLWYLAYRLPVRKLPFEADLTFVCVLLEPIAEPLDL
jgi:hypothetical protein